MTSEKKTVSCRFLSNTPVPNLCIRYFGQPCSFHPEKLQFNESFKEINLEQACENRSNFENLYFEISPEQLEGLKDGKVLCTMIEDVGVFIKLKTGSDS